MELVGTEDMEGTEAYKIKVTKKLELAEGETEEEAKPEITYYFIDAENFVILKTHAKTNMRGAEVEVDTYYSDYKEAGDFIMAYNIETDKLKSKQNLIF